MRKLIINADDLGIAESTNEAILVAHREGILTSTSLMSNMPAFDHAVENVVRRCPNLGVGLHFCLTSGCSVSPKESVKSLVDNSGRFRQGFFSLLKRSRSKEIEREIECELHAQVVKAMDAGVSLDHINSHRHIHMIPAIFRVIARVAKEYAIPAIRISREPWPSLRSIFRRVWSLDFHRNWPKNTILRICSRRIERNDSIFAPDFTFGILDSGKMNSLALQRILNSNWDGVAEIVTHPGYEYAGNAKLISCEDLSFIKAPFRQKELEALIDPRMRELVHTTRTDMIDFGQMKNDSIKTVEACQI